MQGPSIIVTGLPREDIKWSHINAQIKLERGGEEDEGKDRGNKQKRVMKMVAVDLKPSYVLCIRGSL